MEDIVCSPEHYRKFKHQPVEVMKERMTADQYEGFLWGNAMKYIMRYGQKDSKLQEVLKAITYLNMLTEFLVDKGVEDMYHGKAKCNEGSKT